MGQEKYDEAEPVFLSVVDGFTKLGEGTLVTPHNYSEKQSRVDRLSAMDQLGYFYVQTKRYAEAETWLNQALTQQIEKLGEEDPDTLLTVSHLGELFHATDRPKEAVAHSLRALEGLTEVYHEDHPLTFRPLLALAVAYRDLEQTGDARKRFAQALERFERVLDIEHDWTLEAYYRAAEFHYSIGEYDEAETLVEKLMQHTPEDDPDYAERRKLFRRVIAETEGAESEDESDH